MRAHSRERARGLLFAAACLCSPAWCAGSADQAQREARDFLLRYAGLTAAGDAAAIELYRDDARVHIAALMPDGRRTAQVVDGQSWKRELRARWFDGHMRLEPSSFTSPILREVAGQLHLRAQRYSHARCYWDRDYAVSIVPDDSGHYRIVNERLSIRHDTACPSDSQQLRANAGPGRMQINADAGPARLPMAGPRPTALPPNVVPSGQPIPRVPSPAR